MGVYSCQKKEFILGERGRFWEGRTQMFKGGGGGIFREGGVDYGRVAYIFKKGGIF